jgi:HD-GYP domain-containing protein (c-di-GMP phosphodiesterase class II)
MSSNKATENISNDHLLKISSLMDEFEKYQHPHSKRLSVLADALASIFHLSHHDRVSLHQAALVHDIGEVAMNRSYLQVNRILNEGERIDMQRHPVIGEQEAAKRGLNRSVQLLVRWHHEWWNGSGYPDGLQHEEIPLSARILRVVDTYCALTDSRPYSEAISASEAKRYLTQWAGIEFDPSVVKAFLSLEDIKELESFAESNL